MLHLPLQRLFYRSYSSCLKFWMYKKHLSLRCCIGKKDYNFSWSLLSVSSLLLLLNDHLMSPLIYSGLTPDSQKILIFNCKPWEKVEHSVQKKNPTIILGKCVSNAMYSHLIFYKQKYLCFLYEEL